MTPELGTRPPSRRPTLRVATVVALLLTVGLGTISNFLFLAAFQYRIEWFADPAQGIDAGSASADLFKWAALTDLFSYYLPTAVVALALWITLRDRGLVLATAALAAALGYVLAGGVGASVLAMAGAPLIAAHAQPGVDQAAIETAFAVLIDIVFRAIWQLFNGILLSAWMLGIGLLLRPEQAGFAKLSLILSALFAIGTGLNVLGLGTARDVALGVVFVTWAAWSVWLAILVWRRRPPFDVLDA